MDLRPPVASAYEQYAVAFLRSSPRIGSTSGAYHCGSGSLVNVGGVHGILTAGHVLNEVKNDASFRMVTSVGPSSFADNREVPIEPSAIIYNWAGQESRHGPDIGFIRLPNETRNWALQNRAFYNYATRFKLYKEGSSPSLTQTFYILGALGKNSNVSPLDDGHSQVTTSFCMLVGGVDVSERKLSKSGSLIFLPTYDSPMPETFQGLSGSGVWAVNGNDDGLRHLLIGVAYYQSPPDHQGRRSIVFHSVQWTYEWLIEQVRSRFPNEFESFA